MNPSFTLHSWSKRRETKQQTKQTIVITLFQLEKKREHEMRASEEFAPNSLSIQILERRFKRRQSLDVLFRRQLSKIKGRRAEKGLSCL
jgi:hypothetical protein